MKRLNVGAGLAMLLSASVTHAGFDLEFGYGEGGDVIYESSITNLTNTVTQDVSLKAGTGYAICMGWYFSFTDSLGLLTSAGIKINQMNGDLAVVRFSNNLVNVIPYFHIFDDVALGAGITQYRQIRLDIKPKEGEPIQIQDYNNGQGIAYSIMWRIESSLFLEGHYNSIKISQKGDEKEYDASHFMAQIVLRIY